MVIGQAPTGDAERGRDVEGNAAKRGKAGADSRSPDNRGIDSHTAEFSPPKTPRRMNSAALAPKLSKHSKNLRDLLGSPVLRGRLVFRDERLLVDAPGMFDQNGLARAVL